MKRYEKWKDIVRVSGPAGLRLIKGFHDEALEGEWQGLRSSRLDRRYRLIYEVLADEVRVYVIAISAHDHRMRQVDDKKGLSKGQEDGQRHGG